MAANGISVPPILRSPLWASVPRKTSLFDPSSPRFLHSSPYHSFTNDLSSHWAYKKLSNGIKRVLNSLVAHIDAENTKLVAAIAEKKWNEIYRAGLCEGAIDDNSINQMLQGAHCTDRLVSWLGSCVIDAMLDAHLDEDDIDEAQEQIAKKYVYDELDVVLNKEGQLPSRETLDDLFNVAVKQINDGLQVEEENRRQDRVAIDTTTSYLALPGPTSAEGSVFVVLFIFIFVSTTITDEEKDFDIHSVHIMERERSLSAVTSTVGVLRSALCMANLCTHLASLVSELYDPLWSIFSF